MYPLITLAVLLRVYINSVQAYPTLQARTTLGPPNVGVTAEASFCIDSIFDQVIVFLWGRAGPDTENRLISGDLLAGARIHPLINPRSVLSVLVRHIEDRDSIVHIAVRALPNSQFRADSIAQALQRRFPQAGAADVDYYHIDPLSELTGDPNILDFCAYRDTWNIDVIPVSGEEYRSRIIPFFPLIGQGG